MGGILSSLEDAGRDIAHTAESGWHDLTHAANDVKNKASDAWHSALGAAKDAAHSLADPNSLTSKIGHTVLDGVGMVPIVGTVSETINAGWYAAEGDDGDAAMAAASAIPIGGDFADAARLGKDGVELIHAGVDAARAERTAATVAEDLHAGETATHDAAVTEKLAAHEPAAGTGSSVTKEDITAFRDRIGVPRTQTVGIGRTDVPGLEGDVFEGASPRVRQEAGLPKQEEGPIQSPALVAAGRNRAEQDIANQFVTAVDKAGLKPSDLDGHTLTMRIDNETGICSTCKSGLANPDVESGVIKQLSERYPGLTVHVIVNEPGEKTKGMTDFLIRNGEVLK